MPPSTRRSAQKRQTDTRATSDPDLPDSSPSRPSAKRKKPNATASRRPRRPKTPDAVQDEESDFVDDSASEAEAQTLADKIASHLAVARVPVAVTNQHHNSQAEGTGGSVKAFAKICGRQWTYYVKELVVVIGRPPDPVSRHSSNLGAESSPVPLDDSDLVHIDLGPSKTISRSHAELYYAMEDQQWHVHVKGRNGLRVNDRDLRRGQESVIGCGDVLEIAGTQMIFITAGDQANIHPMFLGQIDMHADDDQIAGRIADPHAHPEPVYMPSSSRSQLPAAPVTSSQTDTRAAIVPAPPNFVRPTTPTRSPRRSQHPSSAVKNSPAYARAYMVETTEQIDYSHDATKDLKPSIPYGVMITQAILSEESETMSLSGIYKWITRNFAYYRHLSTNWQNSIRHNLSLNAAFEKVPRGPGEPGKGMKWHIKDDKRNEMIAAVAKHMKKCNARHSSAPNSPSMLRDDAMYAPYPPSAPLPPHASSSNPESNGIIKASSPPSRSPPLAAYPTAQESYTPSRGSRLPAHDHSHNLPSLSDDPSPLPIRRNNIKAGITDSSPVLTSGFYDSGTMMTPAPRQHNLNVPLPNTIKLPTSHMAESSPAPFWNFGKLAGSTPAKWPDMSPLKGGNLQSSSPPPGAANGGGMESPTRGRGPRLGGASVAREEVDEEDGGGVDLARGFLPISTYHQQLNTANAA